MLFDVFDLCVLAYVEAVSSAVLAGLNSAVVDSATRDNKHVCTFFDMEIVINKLLKSALCKDNGNMHALASARRLDVNINTGLVCFLFNDDVLRGNFVKGITVNTDGICTSGHSLKVCDLTKNIKSYTVKLLLCHYSSPPDANLHAA